MAFNKETAGRVMAIAIVALFAFSTVVIIPADEGSSATDSITVRDGRGISTTFDKDVGHVVSLGKGTTATVIQLGCLDKIVVCDNYSKGSESVFDGLNKRITEGKIKADGNCYSSGSAAFKSNVIDAADTAKGGSFDKENDVLIITASKTYADPLITFFNDEGFKKILVWYSIGTYDEVIDFATVLSKVLTGSISEDVKKMGNVRDSINQTLSDKGITTDDKKAKAFYVTVSSGSFKVGNTGSVASSMIQAAGGVSVTVDESKKGSTYAISDSELVDLKEKYGSGLVVFIDALLTESDISKLKTDVGNDVKIVKLESLWNNYSIDSMTGVWTMACAMYPEYFSGDVPEVKGDSGSDNTLLYVGAGIGTAILILVVALYFMKRK